MKNRAQLEASQQSLHMSTEIFAAQSVFGGSVHRLTKELISECSAILGPAPCKFAFCALGSMASGIMSPYSDIEMLLLIELEKYNFDQENKAREIGYFEKLLNMIETKVSCLCEGNGYHFDHEGHPRELRLRGSPKVTNSTNSVWFWA